MEKITKATVYKSVVDMTKKTGQGLSGIVKIKSMEYAIYLDALVDDGLIVKCDIGTSIGHSDSNNFYMPTTGYNVWLDNGVADFSQYAGKYLTFVRLFLGIEDQMMSFMQDPEQMISYSKWLVDNKSELDIMLNLSDHYSNELSDEDIEYIKTRDWYISNNTISECIEKNNERRNTMKDLFAVHEKLITLYTQLGDTESLVEIKKIKEETNENNKEISMRNHFSSWFEEKDENENIKNLIK